MKKMRAYFGVLPLLFLLFSCQNGSAGSFYDKADASFGVLTSVPAYTIQDSKSALASDYVRFHGRYYRGNSAVFFSYSDAGFEVAFEGTVLEASFLATNADSAVSRPYLGVCIDGDLEASHARAVRLSSSGAGDNQTGSLGTMSLHGHVVLAYGLSAGKHTARIYKRSECQNSQTALVSVSTDGSFLPLEAAKEGLKIEVYGDSVTCGYAVESTDYYENFTTRTENAMMSYAHVAGNLLAAETSLISAGGYPLYQSIYSNKNTPSTIPQMFSLADFTYATTDSNRHVWNNALFIPDVVVIALGANDGSVLAQKSKDSADYKSFLLNFKASYGTFFDTILTAYPTTRIIVSSEIIPIASDLEAAADEAVAEYNNSHSTLPHPLLRFKETGYALAHDRTLPGAGHPNEEMHKIAGHQLASAIASATGLSYDDGGFLDGYGE